MYNLAPSYLLDLCSGLLDCALLPLPEHCRSASAWLALLVGCHLMLQALQWMKQAKQPCKSALRSSGRHCSLYLQECLQLSCLANRLIVPCSKETSGSPPVNLKPPTLYCQTYDSRARKSRQSLSKSKCIHLETVYAA